MSHLENIHLFDSSPLRNRWRNAIDLLITENTTSAQTVSFETTLPEILSVDSNKLV